ncbi:MAG: hypothetical protein ABUL64_02610, partial [Singulisphaera sp.]
MPPIPSLIGNTAATVPATGAIAAPIVNPHIQLLAQQVPGGQQPSVTYVPERAPTPPAPPATPAPATVPTDPPPGALPTEQSQEPFAIETQRFD